MSDRLLIEERNLSIAWAKAFLALMSPGWTEITPLVLTVTGIEDNQVEEDGKIKKFLDEVLLPMGTSCHKVANTIFPISLWNPDRERGLLYKRYNDHAWPRIKKCPANYRGTYFRRLISYENNGKSVNQLEHVISTWSKGNHRHSALQVSIFDPTRDHTDSRQMGFPCLHQVAFTPLGQNGCNGLSVTGFYATQHIVEKAYGNYLGLFRLGQFMAHEMKIPLKRLTCIAASARLGVDKSDVISLSTRLRNMANL